MTSPCLLGPSYSYEFKNWLVVVIKPLIMPVCLTIGMLGNLSCIFLLSAAFLKTFSLKHILGTQYYQHVKKRAQLLSGRVLSRDRRVAGLSLTGVTVLCA